MATTMYDIASSSRNLVLLHHMATTIEYLEAPCCHTYQPQLIEHVQKPCYGSHTVTPGGVPKYKHSLQRPRTTKLVSESLRRAIHLDPSVLATTSIFTPVTLANPSPNLKVPRVHPLSRATTQGQSFRATTHRMPPNPACARCATKSLKTHTGFRLGETHSPKRDGLSPKTKSPCLNEMLEQKKVYESLHISPRRAWLA
ncbi:hypothetical protein DEO72_LG9g1761 [Vigna unguiculata]|uniref:Uncharacterized protein n=1 Tax=Vigna unguiculata TaxID=3917 RepID=A0A4D6N403_VIGUN|nr:hypothetical protein DEO72_LG9g1761 [Vigna unguiculata]